MNNYSHEMTLDYNQVYSYHPKYRHYYIDLWRKRYYWWINRK